VNQGRCAGRNTGSPERCQRNGCAAVCPCNRRHLLPNTRPHAKISPVVWPARAAEVRNAFRHAYFGHQKHALPDDELLPVTGGEENKLSQSRYLASFFINPSCRFNGWSVTVVDSLETVWLMELYDDFHNTIPIIANTSFTSPEVRLNFK
jgi:Glycosyl hydrolase family 47